MESRMELAIALILIAVGLILERSRPSRVHVPIERDRR